MCEVPNGEETAAKGVAMLAGVAAGIYHDYRDTAARTVRIEHTYIPEPGAVARYRQLYGLYRQVRDGLQESWYAHSLVYWDLDGHAL